MINDATLVLVEAELRKRIGHVNRSLIRWSIRTTEDELLQLRENTFGPGDTEDDMQDANDEFIMPME